MLPTKFHINYPIITYVEKEKIYIFKVALKSLVWQRPDAEVSRFDVSPNTRIQDQIF